MMPSALAEGDNQINQAKADQAMNTVAEFCKVLVTRMDELIEDEWATRDLQDLAATWDSLGCHQVFDVDERVRQMLDQ